MSQWMIGICHLSHSNFSRRRLDPRERGLPWFQRRETPGDTVDPIDHQVDLLLGLGGLTLYLRDQPSYLLELILGRSPAAPIHVPVLVQPALELVTLAIDSRLDFAVDLHDGPVDKRGGGVLGAEL